MFIKKYSIFWLIKWGRLEKSLFTNSVFQKPIMPAELLVNELITNNFKYAKALTRTGMSKVINNGGFSFLKLNVKNPAIITNVLPNENQGKIAKIKLYRSIFLADVFLKSTQRNTYRAINENNTSTLYGLNSKL